MMRGNVVFSPAAVSRKRRLRHACFAAAAMSMLSGVIGAGPAAAQDGEGLAAARALEQSLVDVIARAERSVVSIARVESSPAPAVADRLDPFGIAAAGDTRDPSSPGYIPEQFGSGVLIGSPREPDARFVLTTCHVAFGSEPLAADARAIVYIRLPGGETARAEARPQGADRRSDLAVLRVNLDGVKASAEDLPVLAMGDAEGIQKGRIVVALGNPYALARDGSSSASIGIVSNISRRPAPSAAPREAAGRDAAIQEFGTLLQVDTRLNLGTSGGALLNLDGELIGITTSLAALQGYEQSVGYAIPFDAGTRRIVEELLAGYEVEYGFLGIAPSSQSLARFPSVAQPSAVLASLVAIDSPAWAAGLRDGDVVLSINGRRVLDTPDLMRMIGLLGPDAEAALRVLRPGTRDDLRLVARLGKYPVYDDRSVLHTRTRFETWRGLDVDYSTSRQRFLPSDRLDRYRRAVVVTGVTADSAAAQADLAVGDFITLVAGTAVETPAEFHAAVRANAGAVVLTLGDGRRLTVAE